LALTRPWAARVCIDQSKTFVSANQKYGITILRNLIGSEKLPFLPPIFVETSECLFVPESDCLTTVILYWRYNQSSSDFKYVVNILFTQ